MEFSTVKFMSAEEKAKVYKSWCSFLKGLKEASGPSGEGFGTDYGYIENPALFKRFTKRLYEHLINHCSFIAHFNKAGFFATYFNEMEDTIAFLGQFLTGVSVEYGMTYWLEGEYADINRAMVDEARRQFMSPEAREMFPVGENWLPWVTANAKSVLLGLMDQLAVSGG